MLYDDETKEHRHLRYTTLFAIAVSTSAVIAAIVTLPLLYSYVASFQSRMIVETEFCKVI
jgi:hypothetical protein